MVMAQGITNVLEQMADRQDNADALFAAQRDRAAFEDLVATHRERINRLTYRLLGWSHDAEDVTQEVFLAAMRNLSKFRGQSSLSTWLTRIAVNKARSHQRKLRSRIKTLAAVAKLSKPASESEPQAVSAKRELFFRVRQAVQALPSRYREVVVMRYLEQMPSAEVVKVLGISRSAMDARLHRARRKLKAVLSDVVDK